MIKQVTADRLRVVSNEMSEMYSTIFKIEQLVGRKHTAGREREARVLAGSLSIRCSYMLRNCADLGIPAGDIKRAALNRAAGLIDTWSTSGCG